MLPRQAGDRTDIAAIGAIEDDEFLGRCVGVSTVWLLVVTAVLQLR
jgi:hypothetical protein